MYLLGTASPCVWLCVLSDRKLRLARDGDNGIRSLARMCKHVPVQASYVYVDTPLAVNRGRYMVWVQPSPAPSLKVPFLLFTVWDRIKYIYILRKEAFQMSAKPLACGLQMRRYSGTYRRQYILQIRWSSMPAMAIKRNKFGRICKRNKYVQRSKNSNILLGELENQGQWRKSKEMQSRAAY